MKNVLFPLIFCLVATAAFAQDGKKLMKQASKTLSKFVSKPAENPDAMAEIQDLLGQAFDDQEYAASSKAWVEKGNLYSELANSQMTARILDPEATLYEPNAGILAFDSYKKGLELATKKGDTKKALEGLSGVETHLSNFGIELYKVQDYNNAYANFNGTLEAYEILKANDKKSKLDDPITLNDQTFFTAVCGYYGDNKMEVKPLLQKLYDNGTDEAMVYEALYQLTNEEDPEASLVYLEASREKFPDDTRFLFAEINYYLDAGKLDILIEKLQVAQEKEPENMSVANTLGNVYEQLAAKSLEDGDMAGRDKYTEQAMAVYNSVIEKDPENFDATYSLGAIYYNEAANMTSSINELANDFTPAGTKKYEELKAVMDGQFDKAMPYFLKAEGINATDGNTLIALKEIYARKSNFEKVEEYKLKYENAVNASKGN